MELRNAQEVKQALEEQVRSSTHPPDLASLHLILHPNLIFFDIASHHLQSHHITWHHIISWHMTSLHPHHTVSPIHITYPRHYISLVSPHATFTVHSTTTHLKHSSHTMPGVCLLDKITYITAYGMYVCMYEKICS